MPRGLLLSAYKLFLTPFDILHWSASLAIISLFNDYCRINPILVLAAWPIKHERFTFHEWFNGSMESMVQWINGSMDQLLTSNFYEQPFIYN